MILNKNIKNIIKYYLKREKQRNMMKRTFPELIKKSLIIQEIIGWKFTIIRVYMSGRNSYFHDRVYSPEYKIWFEESEFT